MEIYLIIAYNLSKLLLIVFNIYYTLSINFIIIYFKKIKIKKRDKEYLINSDLSFSLRFKSIYFLFLSSHLIIISYYF